MNTPQIEMSVSTFPKTVTSLSINTSPTNHLATQDKFLALLSLLLSIFIYGPSSYFYMNDSASNYTYNKWRNKPTTLSEFRSGLLKLDHHKHTKYLKTNILNNVIYYIYIKLYSLVKKLGF